MRTATGPYHPAERALLKKREAIFEQRFEARSRREGRRKRIIIADATMQVRERPSCAKRLWSAELQFRFQLAHNLTGGIPTSLPADDNGNLFLLTSIAFP